MYMTNCPVRDRLAAGSLLKRPELHLRWRPSRAVYWQVGCHETACVKLGCFVQGDAAPIVLIKRFAIHSSKAHRHTITGNSSPPGVGD
jgi:hypothetical protein